MGKKRKTFISFFFVLLVVLIAVFYYSYQKMEFIKKINSRYSVYVKTIRDANLFKKENYECKKSKCFKYIKIGNVKKNEIIFLDKKNKDDIYFKVKDNNYYIKYEDVKKVSEKEIINGGYLNYGIKVKTKSNFYLTKQDKIIYNFKNISNIYEVIIKDNNYKVIVGNSYYDLDKKFVKKEIKSKDYKDANSIIILNYESIIKDSNKCGDIECVKYSFFKDNIRKLIKNNYYFLTEKEYLLWKNNHLKLKENSVLIIVKNIKDVDLKEYKNIININSNLVYVDVNKPSTKDKLYRYNIFDKILNKEEIDYEINDDNHGVAVINYHFFYDPKKETCNEDLCEPIEKFKEHLSYLKNEGFKTLTIEEFNKWMYKKISIPKKSVLITVDDGGLGTNTHLINILNEYKLNATLFIITAWYSKEGYKSPFLSVQSHGNNIHLQGKCGKAKALCMNEEELTNDIKSSLNNVDSNISLAYPFYAYNGTFKKSLSNNGISLGFAGGYKKAYQNTDKYQIPRFGMTNYMTVEDLKRIVN